MLFTDRRQAGHLLARRLDHLHGQDLVVLGLPRGGVPVAYEVAQALGAPLDVILARKLRVPFHHELAMGAIGEDGVRVLNDEVVCLARVTDQELADAEQAERLELERRARHVRRIRPRIPLAGRTAVIVDDGIATGSTARAACQVARAAGAARVVVAVPVAPPGWEAFLRECADEMVAIVTPEPFYAVGQFYADFSEVPNDVVARYLEGAVGEVGEAAGTADPPPPVFDGEVRVGPLGLPGRLTVPNRAIGVVVFAHGSGSSRHSPRNRYVAAILNQSRLATLLFDLLTPAEEVERANVFDIDLLARRLAGSAESVRRHPAVAGLPVGYFGASTGAAAALSAAALPGADIAAVVSRGGRPDLAGSRLGAVGAPTLLIVGGRDHAVLELNRRALGLLPEPSDLIVIPSATHLFEEPGTLAAAAAAARDWFIHEFAGKTRSAA